jgi:hypothetical protein
LKKRGFQIFVQVSSRDSNKRTSVQWISARLITRQMSKCCADGCAQPGVRLVYFKAK